MPLQVPNYRWERGENMAAKRRTRKKAGARDAASAGLDQKLVKALSHPLRVQILAVLNDRTASPNMLSKELEEGLSQVSYHVKVLKDLDSIEMVKTEPRRGAVEHYYRAKQRAFVPTWLAKAMPKSTQFAMANDVLGEIDKDLKTSLEQGTFYRRRDLVVARDPQIFDSKACEDAEELAAEFVERFGKLGAETATRLTNGESDESFPVSAVLLVFGSALGKKLKHKKRGSKGRR
jgi:DNA-binding transcriptional ArsR family regulator